MDPFSKPLQFLTECHDRIRIRLATFRQTAEALRADGDIERHPVEAALLFFRTSGEGHTIDEERSLFPRLRERLRQLGETEALEQIDSLEGEHRHHEAAFEKMVQAMRAMDPTLGEGDGLPDPDAPRLACGTPAARELAAALETLVSEYEAHIPIEDGYLFPLAERVIPPEEQAVIAAEMRGRRALGRKLL